MNTPASNPLNVDVIVAYHPEHGFVVDGYVSQVAEKALRHMGYDRNEDDILALPRDLDEEIARARQVLAAQLLAATRHSVMVLPDDQAAALADAATQEASAREDYIAAANTYYASSDAVLPPRPTFCPECDEDKPAESDSNADHVYADNGVLLIGCEGYYVQDPNLFGITAPNWQDWRNAI